MLTFVKWGTGRRLGLNTTGAFFQGILLISHGAVLLVGCPQSQERRRKQNLWNSGEIKRYPEVETLPVTRDNRTVVMKKVPEWAIEGVKSAPRPLPRAIRRSVW